MPTPFSPSKLRHTFTYPYVFKPAPTWSWEMTLGQFNLAPLLHVQFTPSVTPTSKSRMFSTQVHWLHAELRAMLMCQKRYTPVRGLPSSPMGSRWCTSPLSTPIFPRTLMLYSMGSPPHPVLHQYPTSTPSTLPQPHAPLLCWLHRVQAPSLQQWERWQQEAAKIQLRKQMHVIWSNGRMLGTPGDKAEPTSPHLKGGKGAF